MSFRTGQAAAMGPRHTINNNLPEQQPIPVTPWVRDPSWLTLPPLADTDSKFTGLIAIWPQSNFTAFTATMTSGNVDVDWGDGTTAIVNSGVAAEKQYDYTTAALIGTEAPVTLNSTTNIVERTAHGYIDGNTVTLWNVVGSTGVFTGQTYYVINSTTNGFQVSTTPGGSAVAFGVVGTASLLPYRQAIVTATPRSPGGNLSGLNLNVKNTTTGLQAYETGWLDIEVGSPNFTASGLVVRTGTETVRMRMVERIRIANFGSQTTCVNMFQNCTSLQSVLLPSTTSITNMGLMFSGCANLRSVPLFKTAAVTSMIGMFQNCSSLQSIPLFDTAAVTNMSTMFSSCVSIQTIPLLNTAAVTTMATMFNGCTSLLTVPLFDTTLVNTMLNMFNGCTSLQSVPLFNTVAVTIMQGMFLDCRSIQSVPLFNTAIVTNMEGIFQGCTGLQSVPLFNTVSVTNMRQMFFNCTALTSVPLFNSAAVINMISMFNGCFALQEVPALVTTATSSSANLNQIFFNCSNLARIQAEDFRFTFSVASCKLSSTALNEIYTNLPTVTGQTITVTGNFGTTGDTPAIATAKGWTVTG